MSKHTIANARLISAAPELLEALKDLLAWANIPDDGTGRASDQALCVARNARAAIAKAEGIVGLDEEGIRNARLISAAPELLEALKWIFSEGFYNEDGDFLIRCVPWDGKTNPPDTSDPQVLTFARAAIAKAKGTE